MEDMTQPAPYATKISIPLPSEDEIRGVMGDSYDPNTLNVTKMLAGTGDCFTATVGLVKALFTTDGIDPKLREIVTLRVAKVLNAPYEWEANAKMAANTGLTAIEIDAAASDGPVKDIDADYVLACKAVDELTDSGTLTDNTLSELLTRFGEISTRKILLMIGYFTLLGMFLNGCRVPLETTDKIGDAASPLG